VLESTNHQPSLMILQRFLSFLTLLYPTLSFQPNVNSHYRPKLALASALSPGDKVLVLGRGPVSVLTAKIAAHKGYKTTLLAPPDPRILEQIDRLIYEVGSTGAELPGETNERTPATPEEKALKESLPLTVVKSDDVDAVDSILPSQNALLLCVDSENVIDNAALDYFFEKMEKNTLKRVVLM